MPGRKGLAVLKITDGIQSVNLLANKDGFGLNDWRPSLAALRGGGVWHEPPFANSRRLIHYSFDNVVDTFNLTVNAESQDMAIEHTRKLRQLLQKGRDYWTTRWAYEPVWIEARGSNETKTRYAFIHDWSTPQDTNPYRMPFFSCGGGDTLIDEMTLVVEHSLWQDALPSSPICIPANSYKQRSVNYLTFNTHNYVNFASPSALDDLTLADFTAEAWIRIPVGTVTSPNTPIFNKGNPTGAGWGFGVNEHNRLWATAAYSGDDSYAIQTVGNLADGLWHHVAATFNATTDLFALWVDGANVTGSTTAPTGAPNSDAATDFTIGLGLAADIGWTRMSTTRLYTGAFTPWPRWKLPTIATTTIGAWLWEGYGNILHNLIPGYTLSGDFEHDAGYELAVWGSDIDFVAGYTDGATYSNNPTAPVNPVGGCSATGLFFANSHHYTELTHVFRYDASGASYSANLLLEPLEYYIWPEEPTANDAIYFISQTLSRFSGPFSNIVLNLEQPTAGFDLLVTYQWEYYNGAWVAIDSATYQETPDELDVADGQYAISFVIPSDWTTVAVNGITGYAIRARITVYTSGNSPRQTGQQIHTVTWPYIQIPSTSVAGDLPAAAKLTVQNISKGDPMNNHYRNTDQMFMGLRSLSRGEDFTAYLNISDVQNVYHWLAHDNSSDASWVSDLYAPTGRCLEYSPAAVVDDEIIFYFDMGSSDMTQFYGTYRIFLRGRTISGAASQLSFQLSFGRADDAEEANILWTSEVKDWIGADTSGIIDFGEITIPPLLMRHDEVLQQFYIHIHANSSDVNAKTVHLYDIILIPVDEWFAVASQITDPLGSVAGLEIGYGFMLDSVGYQKHALRILGVNPDLDEVAFNLRVDGSPMILQSSANQRLWFLALTHKNERPRNSTPNLLHGGQLAGANRYFSMRGAT